MSDREQRRAGIILDQHPIWLGALESVLEGIGIDVVGKTTHPEEALQLLGELRPPLLVADSRLSDGGSGPDFIRHVVKRQPDTKVIIVSADDDEASVEEALSAGAAAFVSKVAQREDLVSAVRQVFEPAFYLAAHISRNSGGPSRRFAGRVPDLTRREEEILELVSEGCSNAQVARRLWVTEQTVKFHLSNIYRKLNVRNRTEASHRILTSGLAGEADGTVAGRQGDRRP